VPVKTIGKDRLSPYVPGGRAPFAPDVLRMTLTISNLNGVDRDLMMASGPSFVSTFFDDRKVFRLMDDPNLPTPDNPNARINVLDGATWDQVRDYAIASGAFPLAFPPVPLA
jgi:hypothetical protein